MNWDEYMLLDVLTIAQLLECLNRVQFWRGNWNPSSDFDLSTKSRSPNLFVFFLSLLGFFVHFIREEASFSPLSHMRQM